jgi:hypothetical protein
LDVDVAQEWRDEAVTELEVEELVHQPPGRVHVVGVVGVYEVAGEGTVDEHQDGELLGDADVMLRIGGVGLEVDYIPHQRSHGK